MTTANTLPTGTVTFLFTDIEGSTRLVQRLGDRYSEILETHQALLRSAFERERGTIVGTEGDSFFAVFGAPSDAVAASVAAQRALHEHPWPADVEVRVRMGLHTGAGVLGGGSYVGVDVHRAARIAAAGHGGQVLVSDSTRALVERDLADGTTLRDVGAHRLKDLLEPERIFQVVRPDLPSEFPPLKTLSGRPNNLPTQTSAFFGRSAELEHLRRELVGDARLVTLTGPGGIGKTRLALQAAADVSDSFEDGVFFVDLASVRDADLAFEAVVRAIGRARASERPVLDELVELLERQRVLVVLDNFEQVMEAAAGTAELLHRCPRLTVLVTSRESLRVRGERLLPVPPLGVPSGAAAGDAGALARSEAVGLFLERARTVDVALDDDTVGAIAEVCRRVDGLPLAIELAAARTKLFAPEELLERLGGRLDALGRGARDLPERQQTLRGAIAWSYDLLDEDDRAIFRIMSVFRSARVEAIEAVVARVDERADVVDALASLVDKSLVRSVEEGRGRRLSMLETIRDFAAERLAAEPDQEAVERAHAEHFAQFARDLRDGLYGEERSSALEQLEADLANLIAAWWYWVAVGDLERLDMLVDGLWVLHEARGWYHGAVELTNGLLDALARIPSSPDRAREEIMVRTSLARALMAIRGYTAEVEETYNRALALVEDAGGLPERFPVLRSLASLHLYRAEFDKGAEIGRQLLDLAERQGDPNLQAEGHLRVGANLVSLGQIEPGLEHLERAIALFDPDRPVSGRFRLGPSPGVTAHTTSAFFLWLQGFPDRALQHATTALERAERLGQPYTTAYAHFHVAFLHVWRRDWEQAHAHAASVFEIAEAHDYLVWRATAQILDGVAVGERGRPDEGLAVSDRGLGLYRTMNTPPVFWPLLLSLRAKALALAGRIDEALEHVEQADAIYAGRHNILYPDLPLLRGDLLAARGDGEAAAEAYRHAIEVAREVGGRMPELRATARLVQLRAGLADEHRLLDDLRRVYQTFTEGFETADLQDARAVLTERSA